MKKVLISALMAAGLVAAAGTASAADSGTITFQGSITESACSISGADTNMIVPMGSVAKHEFQNVGDRNTSGADFSISLINCDTSVAANASIAFTPGAGNVVDNRMLSLENLAGAQGVAIALFDAANNPIIVGGSAVTYGLMDGTNQFHFKAFYEATSATVVAGPANGKAVFEVTYS
jgi:major type 1 subunit fimbrin (pilin)